MKNFYAVVLAVASILSFISGSANGQCSTTSGPSYPSGCSGQYYTSITASGAGITSTISYSGSSCSGSYHDYFTTQGIIAPAGTLITMPISRYWAPYTSSGGFNAYLYIFVDWNNSGTYELTEQAGASVYMPAFTSFANYTFTVPTIGVVTGTNLRMRVFLGEAAVSAPCSATWGQSNDYYINVICPLTALAVTPTSGSICAGSTTSLSFTASGASTYTWAPTGGLSATTGATVTALPTATTVYTLTGTDVTGCVGTTTVTATVNPLPATTITPAASAVCAGNSFTLNAPLVAGNTYQWYAGSTLIPGATNSSYSTIPLTSGTYSVQVTSALGCTATSPAATVTVNPLPLAVITPSGPLALCPGSSVTLSVGTGIGYTYQWFESGTPIAGATNATYGTGTAGSYSVRVTTASGCSTTSGSAGVTINPAPTATITVSGPTTYCANDSVTLTANSGAGYTYQWSNGTIGLIPGATNVSYVVHTTNTYSVTVTNSFGCSTTSTGGIAVTVNPLPVTTISAVGATTVCFPNTVTMNAIPGAGYTYQWYRGATLISGATNAAYTAAVSGTYIIDIVNTTTGCAASTPTGGSITISVLPRPSAAITPSTPDARFCSYDSVVLSGVSGPGYTYQWLISGIPITGATNMTYTSRNSGNYKLVVFNGACRDTTATPYTDTVDAAPPAAVSASGPVSFCAGSSVTLSVGTGAGYTYQWYSGPTITISTPVTGATSSSILADTSAYFHAVITSPQGCITTSSVVRVLAVPLPVITAGGPTSFCEGINVVLSVSPVAGAVYQWKRNGTIITGALSNNYVATSTGDYTCFVNVPGICAATTAPVHVTVFPSPHPMITFDGATLRTASTYISYQWYINSVTIAGATTYHTAAYTNASYRVLVGDVNGCSRLSDEYQIFNLAVDNANAVSPISIYPNPATNMLHIDGLPVNCSVSVLSMEGKQIFSSREKDIDVSGLAAGMYMVVIGDDKGRRLHTEKVVKE